MMDKRLVRIESNEREYEATVEPRMLLSDLIRHEARLTGRTGLRARRLRRLHDPAGRRASSLVPVAGDSGQRALGSHGWWR